MDKLGEIINKKNMTDVDRIIRIGLGVATIGAGIYYKKWWALAGLPLVVTGVTGFCKLYDILGISHGAFKKPEEEEIIIESIQPEEEQEQGVECPDEIYILQVEESCPTGVECGV